MQYIATAEVDLAEKQVCGKTTSHPLTTRKHGEPWGMGIFPFPCLPISLVVCSVNHRITIDAWTSCPWPAGRLKVRVLLSPHCPSASIYNGVIYLFLTLYWMILFVCINSFEMSCVCVCYFDHIPSLASLICLLLHAFWMHSSQQDLLSILCDPLHFIKVVCMNKHGQLLMCIKAAYHWLHHWGKGFPDSLEWGITPELFPHLLWAVDSQVPSLDVLYMKKNMLCTNFLNLSCNSLYLREA